MKQEIKNKHFGLAIFLNALVLPGSGHVLIGEKIKGYSMIAVFLFLFIYPLIRFTMDFSRAVKTAPMSTGLGNALLASLSSSWVANKNLIVLSLIAIVIIWIYGIGDIMIKKQFSK